MVPYRRSSVQPFACAAEPIIEIALVERARGRTSPTSATQRQNACKPLIFG